MIINFINIQEHLLEIAVCSLTVLIDYPQNLTNADILGQGNLNLVSEKSGKSQGILLSIICGNPVIWVQRLSEDKTTVKHVLSGYSKMVLK